MLQVSSMDFRDGFVSLASKVGFSFRSYNYVKKSGKNKLPIYIAYMGKRESVELWMLLVGSISDTHLRRYLAWRQALEMRTLYAGLSKRRRRGGC